MWVISGTGKREGGKWKVYKERSLARKTSRRFKKICVELRAEDCLANRIDKLANRRLFRHTPIHVYYPRHSVDVDAAGEGGMVED